MPFDWFNEVLDVLGEVVNFTAIANYAGNAFCEKSWDMILDNNPMLKGQILPSEQRALEKFFMTADIKKVRKGDGNGKDHEGTGAGSNG